MLILKESKLDLAYTFFSNENSKGRSAIRLWSPEGAPPTLHLIRRAGRTPCRTMEQDDREQLSTLRKDSSLLTCCHSESGCVSNIITPIRGYVSWNEFSTAPTLAALPAFGESFLFYEKIQGGTHFFVYMDTFTSKAKAFGSLRVVEALKRHLQAESHWKFAEVIESLLFGYYLKFGEQYLAEALYCIAAHIAQNRYAINRALTYKIREYASNSEIIMMIDQASSPTFFLAECLSNIRGSGQDLEEEGIAMRFYNHLQALFTEFKEWIYRTNNNRKD